MKYAIHIFSAPGLFTFKTHVSHLESCHFATP